MQHVDGDLRLGSDCRSFILRFCADLDVRVRVKVRIEVSDRLICEQRVP